VVKPLTVCAALFLLTGCDSKNDAGNLNTAEVTFPNGKSVVAETMLRDVDQMRGMMFRDALAKDRGMLFVHTADETHPYWMYQVRIPLDIIWMDHSRRIVEIAANAPPCPSPAHDCPSFGGHEKSRYVLELAGGGAALYGLKMGDQLNF
jgi:uncharacterized membrane protein (UPF0127 family)